MNRVLFSEYIQTDDYQDFNAAVTAGHVVHVDCMAHARRKFSEAVKAQGKNKRTSNANGLEPYAYLRHLYTQLSKAESVDAIEDYCQATLNRPS